MNQNVYISKSRLYLKNKKNINIKLKFIVTLKFFLYILYIWFKNIINIKLNIIIIKFKNNVS